MNKTPDNNDDLDLDAELEQLDEPETKPAKKKKEASAQSPASKSRTPRKVAAKKKARPRPSKKVRAAKKVAVKKSAPKVDPKLQRSFADLANEVTSMRRGVIEADDSATHVAAHLNLLNDEATHILREILVATHALDALADKFDAAIKKTGIDVHKISNPYRWQRSPLEEAKEGARKAAAYLAKQKGGAK